MHLPDGYVRAVARIALAVAATMLSAALETDRALAQQVVRLPPVTQGGQSPQGREVVPARRVPLSGDTLTTAAAASPLTLEQLESIALASNPTLAQAVAAIEMQRGTWQQAGLYPNPQIGYLRTDVTRAGATRSDGIFASQEIVTAHKIKLAQEAEQPELERLKWELEAQRRRVLNDLHIRYFELLAAQDGVATAEELERLAAGGVELIERLIQAQGAARPDLLQARIQLNLLHVAHADARFRRDAAWRQMAAIIGQPDLRPQPVAGRLDERIPELDWKQSWEQILATSPQMRSAEIRIEHARRELRREQAQPYPNLTLQTVTEFDHTMDSTNVTTLLSAPLPLFNRNQGNIFKAEADVREGIMEARRVQLVLRDQLADSFRRYLSARNQVAQFQKTILPDAKENLQLVTRGQEQGEFSLFQVLTARQTYSRTRLAYVESLAELHKVVVEIQGLELTGGLNPATLGTAIQTQGAQRQAGLLNQLQEGATQQSLPAAVQSIGP